MCNRLVAPYPTGAECATKELHTVEEADMPEPLVTTREVQIAAAPAEVWDALADPDALSAWFDAEARLDLRPAGTGRFVTEDGETRLAVVEEVDAPRHVVFTWWPVGGAARGPDPDHSRVTIDIEPTEDGSRVRVTEEAVALATRAYTRPTHARRARARA